MSDKIFDLFYYFIPGSFWIVMNLLIFKRYFISSFSGVDPAISIALLLVISIVAGLFIELISWWLFREKVKGKYEGTTEERDKLRYVNRILFAKNMRILPEHYSGRAEFFRNMIVVFGLLTVSYLVEYFCISRNELDFFGITLCAVSALISYSAYNLYAQKEVVILRNYYEDLSKKESYITE